MPVADYIVGHGRHNDKHGMTPQQQIDKSTRFRDGHFNTLVSTSVVKEGIDVGSCRVGYSDQVPAFTNEKQNEKQERNGKRK